MNLRVLDIVSGTSVDGPGLRTSIYFAGCHHQCPGCHNPQSWNPDGGKEMTAEEIMEVISENGFNVTFSGGDPLYQAEALATLARDIKDAGFTIWCYTGFRYEDILHKQEFKELMNHIDVLVDGPFLEAQRDLNLRFRGSKNQRLIDVASSCHDHIVLWHD